MESFSRPREITRCETRHHLPCFWPLTLTAARVADDDPARNAYVPANDPLGEPATKVVYLSQNWSPSQSLEFSFTAQGSQIIPYDWFLALEQADSTTLFLDNQNILKYRYLPQNPGPLTPTGCRWVSSPTRGWGGPGWGCRARRATRRRSISVPRLTASTALRPMATSRG